MIDMLTRSLADTDPEVQAAITAELTRQQDTLEMIASENFAPIAVMHAQGSVLTNKYAEGYPGRRYYGGCENVRGAQIIAERLLDPEVAAAGVSVVTGGTDVHLVLVDLRDSDLDGQQGEDRLHQIGITVNRNAVPFDPRPPMVSSGLRIGTPALATRGFDDGDFREVADIIAAALKPDFDAEIAEDLGQRVSALAAKHPLYPKLDDSNGVR